MYAYKHLTHAVEARLCLINIRNDYSVQTFNFIY